MSAIGDLYKVRIGMRTRQQRSGSAVQDGRDLVVRSLGLSARRGWLEMGGLRFACALGRGGQKARKREGDGATPVGSFRLERVLWRADRALKPRTGLAARPIRPDDGWCDDPRDRSYNRLVRHPYPASAERLWRADHLYDLVVVLSHNECPRIRGLGSAVFMHLARPGFEATAGCIALSERDLRLVLSKTMPGARVVVGT